MFAVLLFSIFTIFLIYEFYWKRRNLPPGPCPIPIFGNLMSLKFPPPGYEVSKDGQNNMETFTRFKPHIMINTYEKIKETFIRDPDTYVNKTKQSFNDLLRGGDFGVVNSNGERWRDHRRFALSTLRDFGLGKNLMRERILLEVQDIFSKFDSTIGSETEIPPKFDVAIANVINQVLFGYRFDETKTRQEEFEKLKIIIDAPVKSFGKLPFFLAMNVRFIEKILPDSMYHRPAREFRESAFGFFKKQIDEHKKSVDLEDLGSESSDYVETYLKEQRKRELEGDTESFSDVQLANMCLDLWFSGLATTRNTITWAISYMLHYPDVQQKVHEELNKVIGSDRLITTADKNDLPYMNAFINVRGDILFKKNTVINGYRIPEGTGVVAQISTVMNDESIFPDHKSFKPERFIDDQGRLKKVEELIPFSTGKRQRLGEGLARMELFLFISNFFNRYQVQKVFRRLMNKDCFFKVLPSKDGPPSLNKSSVSLVAPRMFSAVVNKRK
ncbi:hypothetical protein CAEBREN_32734 [Caenorhabditis brenneri]|uniref:Uncharacterized protein n=1 Tax=Caenorhabditis brenneri TaxID=135651 RepID=G0PMX6_CAEBE|nr:hypothetical protein CAEBREN_32734 [Caenorhabditis brenneri]